MVMFLCLILPLVATADQRVEQIFAQVKAVNPKLEDYAAEISIQLEVKVGVFPYRPTANGTYYYKKPDHHKLELTKAPSYLKDYPSIFGWHLPDLEKYRSLVQEESQDQYYIVLLPKGVQGDIQRIEIWVDKKTHTVPRHITYYSGNGRLEVNGSYERQGEFLVFESMNARFEFPKASVQAKAAASYSNYRFNQGLSDEFFQK